MSTRPVIETVVIQPTPFCNIACSYCYLPHRSDRSVMSPETLRALFERVFASGWAAPALTVIWHAGEPLVLPVSYYREAFDLIESLRRLILHPWSAPNSGAATSPLVSWARWVSLWSAPKLEAAASAYGIIGQVNHL